MLFSNDFEQRSDLVEAVGSKVELIFWALLTFGLTYLHDFFEKRNVHAPKIAEVAVAIYLYAAIFLSARFNLFYNLIWWDMLLHTFSGVLLGFLGFLAIYKINMRYSMNISPLLAASFAFGFSISLNVFFEIYEFAVDVIFGTAMQSWDLPDNMLEIGMSFQGSGLRDTMSDLMCDTAGALVISVICYFLYKNEKKRTLQVMREMFPR